MLTVTINGRAYGPRDVRDELTMNDFLREYLGMTGTKFGCGAAQCLSCAIIVDNPDGTSYTSPTCIVPATSFNGKSIRTVEGLAKNGELSVLQKAFIEHFSFQCGYCTAGFLNESQVLLERLAKKPVARAEVEKTIAEALDGHLCRCTGYIKYHEAVRAVILADPGRYLVLIVEKARARKAGEDVVQLAGSALHCGRSLVGDPAGSACGVRQPVGSTRERRKLFVDRRPGGPVGGDIHRTGQGADPPTLSELPPRRRPPAPGRHQPAAPAAGCAWRRRIRTSGHALSDLPPAGQLRSRGACPAIRSGISRRVRWRGKARRSAKSVPRSRTPRATATEPEALIEHIGEDHLVGWAWAPGSGRNRRPARRSRRAHSSRRG